MADTTWPEYEPDVNVVPFAFSTDSMGFSVGVAGLIKGAGQPQSALIGAGLMTDKGTWISYFGANNYTLSADSRWLLGLELYSASYKKFDYFVGPGTSNDSTADDAIVADAREDEYRFTARYILPLGAAKSNGLMAALRPNRPVTGNVPWESGVTSIEFRPFYQGRKFANESLFPVPDKANNSDSVYGLETRLDWDNRNNSRNPTEGSRSQFTATYDPGSSDRASWMKWEASQSWFWDVGPLGELLDQQVVAFNIYTADTPTWNQTENIGGREVYNRPPEYAANSLGGLYRLRSFQSNRYVGRSAMSYSMEYRVLPDWQPLGDWPIFNWYDVPWWQWVAFADVGRVADDYNLVELHKDMKWSAGGAVRFQVEGIVVRAEMAWGSEDNIFRVMVNQPF
ncbi:hypothetical protein A3K86_00330 [Photobacterium jeanii]|uniref:Bacterial surface antigen (D15) domain-containing protein n=1 Tax=Photobacterium jeanii TaxID=858640 RepID=A0A178KQ06_9GAMM|nr:hypothetical protein A3K86_00330 [Photobacterium jeanii]PST86419.1 hypothetical protein C9I91_21565 [Photobacterium jeanii]